jgi:probable F420-dependent oxidoreductase
VKIGISLPHVGPSATPDAIRQTAIGAELAGYDSVWVLDRVLVADRPHSAYPASTDGKVPEIFRSVLDPIGALTVAATVTERVRLGTSVLIAPLYPPVLLARALTTLDQVSDGRLDVGLGLGWSLDEYEAAGVEQRDLAARLEECLDVLDAAWGPNPVSHNGPRVHIAPSEISPKPVQGRPPVYLAAYTRAGLQRVARRADGWNPAGLPVELLAPMWAMVRDDAASVGRDPEQLRLVVRANIGLTDRPIDGERPAYFGSLEQVAEDLDATSATGAHEVVLGVYDGAETVEDLLAVYDGIVDAAGLGVGV